MKLDQATIEWVKQHERILDDLKKAEQLVRFGKIVLIYQDGKYIGMDACPRERIASNT